MDCHWQWDGHAKGDAVPGPLPRGGQAGPLFSVDPHGLLGRTRIRGQPGRARGAGLGGDHLLDAILSQKQRRASILRKMRRSMPGGVFVHQMEERRRRGGQARHFREEGAGSPRLGTSKRLTWTGPSATCVGSSSPAGLRTISPQIRRFEGAAPGL